VTFRERLLELLRIPPPPSAPAGDEQVRVFRAAPNYFVYRVLVWGATHVGAGIGLVFGVLTVTAGAPDALPEAVSFGPFPIPRSAVIALIALGEILAVTGFIAELIISGLLLRLDFEQRWYMVSDRSLRIREGLIKVQEKTMTFANIQNVSIRQNPIQRWLGIADLEVRTAGGGTGGQEQHAKPDLHVGQFRGLGDAAGIRDAIRERLKRHADAGLGDPDDRSEPGQLSATVTADEDVTSVAALLRDEARALRLALER